MSKTGGSLEEREMCSKLIKYFPTHHTQLSIELAESSIRRLKIAVELIALIEIVCVIFRYFCDGVTYVR